MSRTRGAKKQAIVDSDDEAEMDIDDEDESPKLFPELSDSYVDNELNLPSLLASISQREKRELLEFKRAHNEVCYVSFAVCEDNESS
jgi:hypothetical protein